MGGWGHEAQASVGRGSTTCSVRKSAAARASEDGGEGPPGRIGPAPRRPTFPQPIPCRSRRWPRAARLRNLGDASRRRDARRAEHSAELPQGRSPFCEVMQDQRGHDQVELGIGRESQRGRKVGDMNGRPVPHSCLGIGGNHRTRIHRGQPRAPERGVARCTIQRPQPASSTSHP